MKKKLFFSPTVIEESKITAIGYGFREITRIFRSGGRDHIEVSSSEAELIWTFTSYLKIQAKLRYPGWCDTDPGYNADDEYAFQEVNRGIFETLRSELDREFPELSANDQ